MKLFDSTRSLEKESQESSLKIYLLKNMSEISTALPRDETPNPRSQLQVSDAVDVAEQRHLSFVRVDDQIGEGLLLLLRPPGETAT